MTRSRIRSSSSSAASLLLLLFVIEVAPLHDWAFLYCNASNQPYGYRGRKYSNTSKSMSPRNIHASSSSPSSLQNPTNNTRSSNTHVNTARKKSTRKIKRKRQLDDSSNDTYASVMSRDTSDGNSDHDSSDVFMHSLDILETEKEEEEKIIMALCQQDDQEEYHVDNHDFVERRSNNHVPVTNRKKRKKKKRRKRRTNVSDSPTNGIDSTNVKRKTMRRPTKNSVRLLKESKNPIASARAVEASPTMTTVSTSSPLGSLKNVSQDKHVPHVTSSSCENDSSSSTTISVEESLARLKQIQQSREKEELYCTRSHDASRDDKNDSLQSHPREGVPSSLTTTSSFTSIQEGKSYTREDYEYKDSSTVASFSPSRSHIHRDGTSSEDPSKLVTMQQSRNHNHDPNANASANENVNISPKSSHPLRLHTTHLGTDLIIPGSPQQPRYQGQSQPQPQPQPQRQEQQQHVQPPTQPQDKVQVLQQIQPQQPPQLSQPPQETLQRLTKQAPTTLPTTMSLTTPWARKFILSRPKDSLLPIPREFLSDGFNLVQLAPIVESAVKALNLRGNELDEQEQEKYSNREKWTDAGESNASPPSPSVESQPMSLYKAALRLILAEEGGMDVEQLSNVRSHSVYTPFQVQKAAEVLYILVHARYVTSPRGLDTIKRMFKRNASKMQENGYVSGIEPIFGRCSRIGCHGMPLLPIGMSDCYDIGGKGGAARRAMRYCPCCREMFYMWESKVDGAAWGTSFAHLFLMVQGSEVFGGIFRNHGHDGKLQQPKSTIYGFPLHPSANNIPY